MPESDDGLGLVFLESMRGRLRDDKDLADRAIAQCSFAQLRASPHGGQNAAAVVMKHLAGNMRSRFSGGSKHDYLTTDGNKADRRRDDEFVDDLVSREQLVALWDEAWAMCFAVVDALEPGDLTRRVTIRGEPHTVVAALHRHLSHAAYHTGQIVTLAKHAVGEPWQTLSIPVGGSDAHNRSVADGLRREPPRR